MDPIACAAGGTRQYPRDSLPKVYLASDREHKRQNSLITSYEFKPAPKPFPFLTSQLRGQLFWYPLAWVPWRYFAQELCCILLGTFNDATGRDSINSTPTVNPFIPEQRMQFVANRDACLYYTDRGVRDLKSHWTVRIPTHIVCFPR